MPESVSKCRSRAGLGFQLATQLRHVRPQVVRLGGVRRVPRLRQQLALLHQLAGVAQQLRPRPMLGGTMAV